MLGKNNDLTSGVTSAEDQMKLNVVRQESEELYQKNLYKEAARRVVFANCMTACEVDHKDLPNFNRQFYYGMPQAQTCLQDCYNTRMKLHFGSAAEKDGLLLDFAALKREFQRYENWHPTTRTIKNYAQENSNEYVEKVANSLIEKTKNARGKFEFQ